MYIKYFQIADRTIEFNKGLNVMVHTPGACQISAKYLRVLESLWHRNGRARNTSEISGLVVTFAKRVPATDDQKLWRVSLTNEKQQVLLNHKSYDRNKLQNDLSDEGVVFYHRDKPMNLLTNSAIDKMSAVDSRETWAMICEAFLHHQLSDHFDCQIETSRNLCEVMMYSKNYERELARLKEELTLHKTATDEYRVLEKRLCALQTVMFKKTVRSLRARQAAFQQSLDHDVEVLTPVLDEIEETEEQRASVKLAAEQQAIAMQNLWHYLQAEVNALEIELDELKSARQLAVEHKQRRDRFWAELKTIRTVYFPREDEAYATMNALVDKRYAAESEAYCKRHLKMVIFLAYMHQQSARQEQMSTLHKKIRELTLRTAAQEKCVNQCNVELRQQERQFAKLEKDLTESVGTKNQRFAGLVDLKRKMFELQKNYAENQLTYAKLSVQLPIIAAEVDEQTKAFEQQWRIEPETITVLNYVELFIQSLPETEQVRIEYMGPLFRQMSMDDDPEEFGLAYEVIKECLVACLFRTHDTMVRASNLFRSHMVEQFGRSDTFVYTFMALETPDEDAEDITMRWSFVPFAEFLDEDCELRELLQFRRLVLVEHSVLANADPHFVAELDEAGYCVLSLDGGPSERITREHGVLCVPPINVGLTFSRFKTELADILDKKLLLGIRLIEKAACAESEQHFCQEIDELRRKIEELQTDLPRITYNVQNPLLDLFSTRYKCRDAAHSLKMMEIDMQLHRAVLVDKRQLKTDDECIFEVSREIEAKEEEAERFKLELAKNNDLEQFSADIKPHMEEVEALEKCLNYDLFLDDLVDVNSERLDATISVYEEQLVHLSVKMEAAVREMRLCEDKLLDDGDESEALTVRARLKMAKSFAKYPNRVDRTELTDLRDQLKEYQTMLIKSGQRRASDVDINDNDLNEVVCAAAATKRELNTMTPPTSDANYKKIINNLNIIEQVEQSATIDASALGHELSPFFEKLTLKNIDIVLQMMESALKLVTGANYRCTFDVDHTIGASLRVRDVTAIAVQAPIDVADDSEVDLVDDKYLKLLFFVCLMVVNKMKFIFVENMDKLVAPELMQKTLLFLKAFEATTQIVVTMQASRVGKHVKKMAPPCECFKMGGKEPRTKRKTGRLQKRRTDEPSGLA